MQIELEIRVTGLRDAVKLALTGLAIGAVVKELNKPPVERTWHGRIAGVPYDFRPPTLERIRDAYWNPDDPRVFTDRVFGLGWAVNLPALGRTLLESARQAWVEVQHRRLAE